MYIFRSQTFQRWFRFYIMFRSKVYHPSIPLHVFRISGMTHVRTSPYYPQSNGKLERWHKTLKGECVRPGSPLSLQEARELVEKYIQHYNEKRLHSAIGYVTPMDKLEGRENKIFQQRDNKLEEAREKRSRKNKNKIAA